jgi:M6 family metalloprotease-like protein
MGRKIRWRKFLAFVLVLMMLASGIPFSRLVVKTQAASTGMVKQHFSNLVIFVAFSDTDGSFMKDENDVNEIVNNYTDETFSKSLVSYVETISYGQLHIDTLMPQYNASTNTITPIQLSGNRADYADYSNEYLMELNAIKALSRQYDLSKYNLDQNLDGYVDNVTFIVEGPEGVRNQTTFYPHKMDYTADTEGQTDYLNGKPVRAINVLAGDGLLKRNEPINNYGVICHEFLHSLGYPDLYTEGSEIPVGRWDLMASSSNFEQYPLAYLRSTITGWLDIDTITYEQGTQMLQLNPVSSASGNEAYIIKSPLSSTEFFVVEYRKQGTRYSDELDVKIPGTGLIIYRVNLKAEKLSNRNNIPYGVYVFREGETAVNAATADNLDYSFFSADCGRTSFGSTDMSKTIKDNAIVFSDGTNSGIQISDIGIAGDTISFKVSFADYNSVETWSTVADTSDLGSDYSRVASIDTDSNGTPYVLYTTGEGIAKLAVKKYNNVTNTWNAVGNMSGLPDYYDNGKLVLYKNIPYVLFNNYNYDLCLYRYMNNSWEQVKTWSAFNCGCVQYACMEAEESLCVCYANGAYGNYNLSIDQYDGAIWTEINPNITRTDFSRLDLAIEENDIYFSSRNVMTNKPEVWVYHTKTKEITEVTNTFTESCDQGCNIAVYHGKLYMLIENSSLSSNDEGVKVFEYSNNTWTQIKKWHAGVDTDKDAGTLVSVQSATSDIAIMDGVPIVQLILQAGGDPNDLSRHGTIVMRYRGGDWVEEGISVIDTGNTNDAQLAVYGNRVYISYISEIGTCQYTLVKARDLKLTSEDIPGDGDAGTPLDLLYDLNEDGFVNVLDMEVLQKHILGLEILSSDKLLKADFNQDGSINVLDMEILQKKILGLLLN